MYKDIKTGNYSFNLLERALVYPAKGTIVENLHVGVFKEFVFFKVGNSMSIHSFITCDFAQYYTKTDAVYSKYCLPCGDL